MVSYSVIKLGPDRWVDSVTWHPSRSKFLIEPVMLLTQENSLKPGGFCANRITQLGYCNPFGFEIFMKIAFLVLLFQFLYRLKLDYLAIYNLFRYYSLIFYYSFYYYKLSM